MVESLTDEFIFNNYKLERVEDCTDFRLVVRESGKNNNIGIIRGFNGAWKIDTDPTFESRQLMKAVIRVISNYNRYNSEYIELKQSFK